MYKVWFDVEFFDVGNVRRYVYLISAANLRRCRKIALYRLRRFLANVRHSWQVVNYMAEEVFLPDKEAV